MLKQSKKNFAYNEKCFIEGMVVYNWVAINIFIQIHEMKHRVHDCH